MANLTIMIMVMAFMLLGLCKKLDFDKGANVHSLKIYYPLWLMWVYHNPNWWRA